MLTLYDYDDLLTAEVVVPNLVQQEIIVKAVKTVEKMWFVSGELMEKFGELKQITGDPVCEEVASCQLKKLEQLHDYRFMLIDQLMGI